MIENQYVKLARGIAGLYLAATENRATAPASVVTPPLLGDRGSYPNNVPIDPVVVTVGPEPQESTAAVLYERLEFARRFSRLGSSVVDARELWFTVEARCQSLCEKYEAAYGAPMPRTVQERVRQAVMFSGVCGVISDGCEDLGSCIYLAGGPERVVDRLDLFNDLFWVARLIPDLALTLLSGRLTLLTPKPPGATAAQARPAAPGPADGDTGGTFEELVCPSTDLLVVEDDGEHRMTADLKGPSEGDDEVWSLASPPPPPTRSAELAACAMELLGYVCETCEALSSLLECADDAIPNKWRAPSAAAQTMCSLYCLWAPSDD